MFRNHLDFYVFGVVLILMKTMLTETSSVRKPSWIRPSEVSWTPSWSVKTIVRRIWDCLLEIATSLLCANFGWCHQTSGNNAHVTGQLQHESQGDASVREQLFVLLSSCFLAVIFIMLQRMGNITTKIMNAVADGHFGTDSEAENSTGCTCEGVLAEERYSNDVDTAEGVQRLEADVRQDDDAEGNEKVKKEAKEDRRQRLKLKGQSRKKNQLAKEKQPGQRGKRKAGLSTMKCKLPMKSVLKDTSKTRASCDGPHEKPKSKKLRFESPLPYYKRQRRPGEEDVHVEVLNTDHLGSHDCFC